MSLIKSLFVILLLVNFTYPLRILVIGDSLASGIGKILHKSHNVLIVCKVGKTVDWYSHRKLISRNISTFHPDLTIITLGTNEIKKSV